MAQQGLPPGNLGVSPVGYWRREHLSRPARLADFTDDLLWPRLLRAVPLALRPVRVLIAFLLLLAIALIWRSPTLCPSFGGVVFTEDVARLWGEALGGAPERGWFAATVGLFSVPIEIVKIHPGWSAGLTLVSLPVLALGGGVISRMVACEFAQSVMIPWPRAAAFVVNRWSSLIGAVLGPLLIAGLGVACLAVAGWALLNWPWVNVAGALAYPLFLCTGLVVTLLMTGYVLGGAMLVPAVACENTDSIDAMQRAYAYVVASPLRLAVYVVILATHGTVVWGVLSLLTALAVGVSAWGVQLFTGSDVAALVSGSGSEGSWRVAGRVISFWTAIPAGLVSAFVLSFFFSGSTVLYLLLRRFNDGQDPAEIWVAGPQGGVMSGGSTAANTLSETPAARAAAGDDE